MKKILILFVVFILLSSITMVHINNLNKHLYIVSFLCLIFIVLVKKTEIKFNKKNFVIFNIVMFSFYLSSFVNNDVALLMKTFNYHLTFVFLVILLPSLLKERFLEIIKKSIFIFGLIVIVFSITVSNPLITPYSGIFTNPNTLGLFLITILSVLIPCFTESIIKNKPAFQQFMYIIAIFINLFLLIQTSSRTSFIVLAILSAISIIILINNKIKNIRRVSVKYIFILPIYLAIVVILFIQFNLFSSFQDTILSKFENKGSNFLSGRDVIWNKTFQDSEFFGNGIFYFTNNFNLPAHNTFIEILGIYGWVPLILVMIYYIHSFVLIIQQCMKSIKENNVSLIPIFVFICFMSISLTESIDFTALMYILYSVIGFSSNIINKKEMLS